MTTETLTTSDGREYQYRPPRATLTLRVMDYLAAHRGDDGRIARTPETLEQLIILLEDAIVEPRRDREEWDRAGQDEILDAAAAVIERITANWKLSKKN